MNCIQLETSITGAVLGLTYGLIGYKQSGNEFSLKKLLPAVVLSGIAGFLIGSEGTLPDDQTLAMAMTSLTALGIDRIVEKLIKFVWK